MAKPIDKNSLLIGVDSNRQKQANSFQWYYFDVLFLDQEYSIIVEFQVMKINRLKFKEISNMVSARNLKLNLFEKQDNFLLPENKLNSFNASNNSHLAEEEPRKRHKTCRNSKVRPRTTREKSPYRNATYIDSVQKRGKNVFEDSLYYLQSSLIEYVKFISSDERKSIKKDLESFLQITHLQSLKQISKKMDNYEINLSKFFKNRIIHLAFYLIHSRLLRFQSERNVEREIKHLLFCQYYSRKFNFKDLTLSICIEIHQIYRKNNNYDQSRTYARKCLRLAVVLGNQFYQSKMIQSLNIINYYEGRLNEQQTCLLNKQERRRILQSYDEQAELPNIFNCETQATSEHQKELAIQHSTNFIQNCVPQENYKYFQTNYHDIVKKIQGKPINIRGIINKVTSVGLVKKYFGKDNYITIRPECHIIKPTNQEQVLITHKKETNSRQQQDSYHRVLKRIVTILEYTIEEYSYHF